MLRPVLVLSILAVAPGLRAAVDEAALRQLVEDSPFRSNQPGPERAAGDKVPLEFRGYVREAGKLLFSVYDAEQRSAAWLALGETQDGLRVRSFDAQRERLQCERNGQVFDLEIAAGKVAETREYSPGAASTALGGAAPAMAPGATPPDSPVAVAEQQLAEARQKQAYEERRRRAAERIQQARAKGGAPAPTPLASRN